MFIPTDNNDIIACYHALSVIQQAQGNVKDMGLSV
jgi:hypothetical protein